ncbi:MAG: creatininase family protein [Thermoguttaceae bacterium]
MPDTSPPWNLNLTHYATVKGLHYEVAVLPLGATEPHNLHLPYSMDTREGNTIGEAVCREAWQRGAKVVLLPTIPYGTQTNQQQFPLAMNLNPSTLGSVITDLVRSLENHGIRKVVLLNSHGGNDLKGYLREMYGKTSVQLFLCNWYTIFADLYDTIFEHPDDHAGEVETSLALAYWPELVLRDEAGRLAGDDGIKAQTRFEAVNRGWVSITRPWHLLTTNSGAGNPHSATADKGRKLMEILVDRLARFLVELTQTQIDDRFPYA